MDIRCALVGDEEMTAIGVLPRKSTHMRKLSSTFLACLDSGFLSAITECVRRDHDLNLEIRDGYINVYYKGNSLLKLIEKGPLPHYKAEIHRKFLEGVEISVDFTESTVPEFVK